ncbi:hypothetical protein ACF0H5_012289 [Mactra antiquata]
MFQEIPCNDLLKEERRSDASSYHVAFLGRANPSESVGSFQFKTSGDKPEITSVVPLCTDAEDVGTIVSQVILNHTECVNLIPQGTEFATRGIAVRSEDKFTLHVFQPFKNEDLGDGYLAIPDDQLGNEYFVATYCTLGGKCQFAITAIEDDTDVTVVFPDELVDPPVCVSRMGMPQNIQPGTAIPFKINEYDTLHFESEQDLSGTFIKASKPISVVVGASDVPGVGGKASSIIEQIVPVNKWGDSFVVAPNHFNQPGDVIKIVSQTDSTVVNILGFSSFMLNKAGDFVERRMDWQMYSLIKTSNPVMIIQIMSIDLYNISTIVSGSQSMLLVPHLKQTIEDGVYFYCEAQEEKVFSVLVPNDGSVAITEPSDDSLYEVLNDLEDIQEASYKLYTVKPSPSVEHVVLSGENLIGYGNCDGSSTVLLAANWSVDNSECIRTISTPGDAVDNDCNGRIDEMQCSLDDLATSFRAIQKLHGAVTYKIFPVRQRTSLKFEVATCGIAIITLRTTDNSKTVTISLYNGNRNLTKALEAPIDFDDVLFSTFLGSASYKIYLKYRRLLHADSPVAVFCGKSGYESFAQMPPRETLGIKHYIPPFKFDDIGITDAVVYVTAVEDSTIVVIKGDYHQLDSVTLTGDVYSRKIESVTMYDIEATKPVQVHLVIENTTGDRHGLVVIPSIEQYTQDFNMFEMIDTYEYTGVVVGVDANGTVGNITLGEPLPHEMFVMSFFKQTVDDILFVVTNGRKYTDINKFCVVTPSNPGDGLDNDCDDLIDEEDCSESIESGNIDVDIDGGVNEDCAENTLGLAENIALLDVLYQDTQCSSEGVISVPNSDTDEEVTDVRAKGVNNYLEISGTIQDFNDTTKHTFNPRNGKTDSRPILMILSTVPTIKIGTLLNIPNSGSSPVPIETCTTDCICPCGWVYEQNITAAEIQMKVIELVRKLTLDKDQLSATIRKKTSAMDKRPSAYTVGTVALIWMAVMIGSVVFLDISSVMRDLKLFRENMRQIFRREKEKKPDC